MGVLSRFRGSDGNSQQMLRDLLRTSMDFEFYRKTYLEAAALTPFEVADHYHDVGAAEGKNPTAWFDTSHYVATNPDVVATGINPFLHYIIYGQAEGRSPAPGVAPRAMLGPATIVQAAPTALPVIDAELVEAAAPIPAPALVEVLAPTKAEALVDRDYYLARYPHAAELIAHGHFRDAAHHYATTGWIEGLDPHPLFSSSYYQRLSHQPIIHGDPFEHYLLVGHRQGHNPSELFDGAWFSAEYPELVAGGVAPLEAHISHPHTFPNSAREFFTAQFDGTLGEHLGACPRAAANLCTELPAEFMTWPRTIARFGPDLGFGQLPNEYPFSGERRPQRIDSPIFVFATKADAQGGEDALRDSTQQTLQAAKAMTTGPIVVLASPPIDSLIADLVAGVAGVSRTLYAELDIASNVAMAARDLDIDDTTVLILGVGIEPTLNSGSILVKLLVDNPAIAIAGASILDMNYRVRNVGFEVAGGALVARGAGLSPLYPQLQAPDPIRSIDHRYFALSLSAVADFSPIPGADMRSSTVQLVDALRANGQQVVINTSVFGVESASATSGDFAPVPVAAQAPSIEDETKKHILILDVGWLTPDRDAGSVYTYNVIKILLDEGHRVSFSAPNLRYNPTYTPLLTGLGVNCLYNFDDSNFIAPGLFEDDAPDVVYMFRYPIGRGYHFEFRNRFPNAKFAFHSLDMHGLRELRQAELVGDLRGINAANRTLVDELLLFEEFDASTVVSEHEIGFVEQRCEDANLHVLAIPVEEPPSFASYSTTGDICFVGSFKHLPNIDAVEWFVDSVWPLILEQDPTRTFHIVGQALPDSVDVDRPGVEYHGFVDDLDGFLANMRLSVAPLRFGAGIKGKVLTSLAAGLPIVATPMAVEGMGIDDGKHALIAKDPQAFADAVLELLGDKRQWNKISKNGKALIEAKFSMRAVREQLISSTASIGVNLDRSER